MVFSKKLLLKLESNSLLAISHSSEPLEGNRYADQPEEQPTCPFLNSNGNFYSTNIPSKKRIVKFYIAKVESEAPSVAETAPAESPAVVL